MERDDIISLVQEAMDDLEKVRSKVAQLDGEEGIDIEPVSKAYSKFNEAMEDLLSQAEDIKEDSEEDEDDEIQDTSAEPKP